MKKLNWILAGVASLAGCLAVGQSLSLPGVASASPKRADKVVHTNAEWKKKLTREQFQILRAQGTEPAFCGVLLKEKGEGVYHCVGCNEALFDSTSKFDSGTGWPSFYKPFKNSAIWLHVDRGFGMLRTEVICAKCDGHLGHLFNDAPTPNGMRFCLNGKVLKFVLNEKTVPKAKSGF